MTTEAKSHPPKWVTDGLWIVEGGAASVAYVLLSLDVSAIIVLGLRALDATRIEFMGPEVVVLIFTIWRRGLPRWAGGIGIPLGLCSALLLWSLMMVDALNAGPSRSSLVGMLAGLLGLGLSAVSVWYRPESFRRWKAAARSFVDGAGSFVEANCVEESLAPSLLLGGIIVALICLCSPNLVVRFMEYDYESTVAALKEQNSAWIPTAFVPPAIASIRALMVAVVMALALAFYVAVRRRGHGVVMVGAGIWLTALGQAGGFALAAFALVMGVVKALDTSPFSPQGWILLAILVIAAGVGFGCYRFRKNRRRVPITGHVAAS